MESTGLFAKLAVESLSIGPTTSLTFAQVNQQLQAIRHKASGTKEGRKFSLIHIMYKGEAKVRKDDNMSVKHNTIYIPLA